MPWSVASQTTVRDDGQKVLETKTHGNPDSARLLRSNGDSLVRT